MPIVGHSFFNATASILQSTHYNGFKLAKYREELPKTSS
jgi:hypothetical protein